jgi:hypothetical protein
VQVAQDLLVGAQQERAQIVVAAIEGVQGQRALHIAAVDELVHLAIYDRVSRTPCMGDYSSPKIGDVPQRKKLSTTIGANNYAYLHDMVKAGRAESVGEAVDKTVETTRRLDNRATLERQTAGYFKGLTPKAAAEEADLEDALSAVSQEMDFDQP